MAGVHRPGSPVSASGSSTRFTPAASSGSPDMRPEDYGPGAHGGGAIRRWQDDQAGREEYEMDEFRPEDEEDDDVAVTDDEDDESDDDGHDHHGSGSSSSRGMMTRGRRKGRRSVAAASVATAESFELYTPDMERAVVRKFDRRLVVFVALLYMLSFLDRSNIGNARIAGMDEDLQTTPAWPSWYDWSLTSFYVAYIAFEWMSLLWRLIPAHIYVSMIVLSWGITASLQAIASSYPMLVALRFLLGIGEAGFTGIPFYLSFFFKRHELALRTAIFISGMAAQPPLQTAPLATTFASSLAWLIIKLGQDGPIAPWRLLFLVEGFPSVVIAAIAWNVIPDSPETARYLTKEERRVARLRMRHEKGPSSSSAAASKRTSKSSGGRPTAGAALRDALAVLADPVAWLTAAMFFLTNMAYASLPVFLPTILTQMGHSALTAQAMAAPPYLSAFLIVLATAHASDRIRSRSPLVAAHALASAAGYALLAFLPPSVGGAYDMARYLAVYPAAVGFFNVVVLLIAWTINNQAGEGRRGGAFALFQLVGQCGPLVGTRLYPLSEGPLYLRGMRVMAGAMLGVALLAGALRLYLVRLNGKLDAAAEGLGGGRPGEVGEAEEEEGLVGRGRKGRRGGEEAFRYML